MPLLQSSSVRPPLDPLAVDLARDVVGEHYPAELTLFDAVLSEFQAYPDRRAAAKALRAPVGMGIDIPLMTPYVLDAALFLGAVVAAKIAETTYDAVRERVSTAWAVRRARRSDPPATVDSGPTSTGFDDGGITVVVTVHLSARGADSATARAVAGHVVGKLLLAGPPR